MAMWLLPVLATVFVTASADDSLGRLVARKFTQKQRACFSEKKFLFEGDGECYPPLGGAPCPKGQWLVLGDDLKAQCKKCPCCNLPQHVFIAADEKCHHRTREAKQFCPQPGTELRDDYFGEGTCACIEGYVRLSNATANYESACYELYTRGPCSPDQLVMPSGLIGAGCVHNPCGNKGVPWAQNGGCYQLRTQAMCPENSIFKVDPNTRQPECVSQTFSIIKLPKLCNTDHNGECQEEVKAPPSDLSFGAELLVDAEVHRRKRLTRN